VETPQKALRAAAEPVEPVRAAAEPQTAEVLPLVVFLGDSLTAGFGVAQDDAFPARLGAKLAAAGRPVRVVNAGVSGDTTAGGLRRLDWILTQKPQVVVVELGANDGLRGLSLRETEANLRDLVARSLARGAKVLLVGMRLPPSLGPDYTTKFAALFPRVARESGVPLVPFLLEGVGGLPELNLPDGIHPTPEGHARVAATVEPYLRAVLASIRPK